MERSCCVSILSMTILEPPLPPRPLSSGSVSRGAARRCCQHLSLPWCCSHCSPASKFPPGRRGLQWETLLTLAATAERLMATPCLSPLAQLWPLVMCSRYEGLGISRPSCRPPCSWAFFCIDFTAKTVTGLPLRITPVISRWPQHSTGNKLPPHPPQERLLVLSLQCPRPRDSDWATAALPSPYSPTSFWGSASINSRVSPACLVGVLCWFSLVRPQVFPPLYSPPTLLPTDPSTDRPLRRALDRIRPRATSAAYQWRAWRRTRLATGCIRFMT